MPPPSSGGVLLVQMLNMLEAYDIGGMGFGSAAAMHHIIEAERRAYADRPSTWETRTSTRCPSPDWPTRSMPASALRTLT